MRAVALNFKTMPEQKPVSSPLLQTKLRIPRVRPDLITRPRLTAMLNEAMWRKVILLCAPPGSGKTTLLSEWADGNPTPIAWLTLDESDNLLENFLTYLVSALQNVIPECGAAALASLQLPQPVSVEDFAASLINDLDRVQTPVVLVLDDFHLVRTPSAQTVVQMLVEHIPACLHLMIASRSDPPLPLHRMRARGELSELRGAELRFTDEEAAAFLERAVGMVLSPEDITSLGERTEGWIAGLQLAALSLRGRKDAPAFIRDFTGSNRYVLDYLLEEVLLRQPDDVQAFLLRTSILDRLCAPLCDAILSVQETNAAQETAAEPQATQAAARVMEIKFQGSSQRMLEHLERANLFIELLDEEHRWYRYHRLFGDLLRYRLEQSISNDELKEMHHRAGDWLAANNFPIEAVANYLAAGDLATAASQIISYGSRLLQSGRANRLLGWLDTLPKELRDVYPMIDMMYAWGLTATGQFERVETYLRSAETTIERLLQAGTFDSEEAHLLKTHILATRATLASTQGDLDGTIRMGKQALAELPGNDQLRGNISMAMAIAYRMKGQTRQSDQALLETVDICRNNDQRSVMLTALCNHGDVLVECGKLRQAFEVYQQALDDAVEADGEVSPIASLAHFGLSALNYEWDELDFAAEHCQLAEKLSETWGFKDIRSAEFILLARIRQARGEPRAALQALEDASSFSTSPLTVSGLATGRLQVWLQMGHLDLALGWMEKHPFDLDGPLAVIQEMEAAARAQALIALRDTRLLPKIQSLLARMLETTQAEGRDGHTIELLTLQALAHSSDRQNEVALEVLSRALEMAQPQGYVRTFVDKGPALLALLRLFPPAGALGTYTSRLVGAFGGAMTPSRQPAPTAAFGGLYSTDTFSSREMEVLRLVAAGLSNAAIAERLIIAPGTVKRHLHNIFTKLGASSRTEAADLARRLDLL